MCYSTQGPWLLSSMEQTAICIRHTEWLSNWSRPWNLKALPRSSTVSGLEAPRFQQLLVSSPSITITIPCQLSLSIFVWFVEAPWSLLIMMQQPYTFLMLAITAATWTIPSPGWWVYISIKQLKKMFAILCLFWTKCYSIWKEAKPEYPTVWYSPPNVAE